MELEKLEKLLSLLRAQGVLYAKVDGLEVHLGPLPEPQLEVQHETVAPPPRLDDPPRSRRETSALLRNPHLWPASNGQPPAEL